MAMNHSPRLMYTTHHPDLADKPDQMVYTTSDGFKELTSLLCYWVSAESLTSEPSSSQMIHIQLKLTCQKKLLQACSCSLLWLHGRVSSQWVVREG